MKSSTSELGLTEWKVEINNFMQGVQNLGMKVRSTNPVTTRSKTMRKMIIISMLHYRRYHAC